MELQKFGVSFKSKKKIESNCPFCQETFETGENVILTDCCQNYIHKNCCKNWKKEICPSCGTTCESKSEVDSDSDVDSETDSDDFSETEGMTEIELLEYNFKNGITNYLYTIEATKFYINSGANINIKDWLGCSLLHYVNTPEQTKLLLDAGADPNIQNRYGNTPLHYSWSKSIEQIRILIKSGADLTIKDQSYRTPEEYLYSKRHDLTMWDYLKKRREFIKREKKIISWFFVVGWFLNL